MTILYIALALCLWYGFIKAVSFWAKHTFTPAYREKYAVDFRWLRNSSVAVGLLFGIVIAWTTSVFVEANTYRDIQIEVVDIGGRVVVKEVLTAKRLRRNSNGISFINEAGKEIYYTPGKNMTMRTEEGLLFQTTASK